jgi:two-component system sensor histidine kinase/response regulator
MGQRILVVDDEPFIVDVVATLLEDEGHTVMRAYDGDQALTRIAHGGCDLLITDHMMPRLSGLELIRRLHEQLHLTIPTILMSAVYPASPPPAPILFLPKPFDLDHLVRLVECLLIAQ